MNPCGTNISVSAIACAMADGRTNDEIALLSAIFTQLGDSLATIVAVRVCNNNNDNINNIVT